MKKAMATVTGCRFQPEAVHCILPRDCEKCGWNPQVAQQRLEAVREKLTKEEKYRE